MNYQVPKNGAELDGHMDRVREWNGTTINLHGFSGMDFAEDGGMTGTRRGFWSNAVPVPVQFGLPYMWPGGGSPRLQIDNLTFLRPTSLRSLYNSTFRDCWWVGYTGQSGRLTTDIDYTKRATWPSNIDFFGCHAQHTKLEIRLSDFRWYGGSVERCGEVVLGHIANDPALSHEQPEKGGGFVECRFESDGDQVVHVGQGVTVVATSATLTKFVLHSVSSTVFIRANHGSTVEYAPGVSLPLHHEPRLGL